MAPMSDSGQAPPGRAPSGGRHTRAQELVERRAGGEELGDYDRRILEAHLAACSPCRQWAEQVEERSPVPEEEAAATVVGGQDDVPRATVGNVEAATPTGDKASREHVGEQTDAMGQDKRRQVVGHSWGPSKARQLLYYGLFVAFVIAVYIGGKIAIDELDKAPAKNADQAPWSKPDAPQTPPQRFQ